MLTPGVVLSDRYRLTERIAAGGMGEVWRGVDLLLHRGVAVKVLLPTLMADGEFIARFRREARVMAALRHPGIVQVYDYGENASVDGRRLDYLVMEYIDGTPLSKRIEAAGRLPVAETMTIVGQVADALQVAHDAGIVHRDVKPSNLLVRPGGAIVLVDFGVARSAGVEGLTSTNVVLGSAHYMAPEQAEGKPLDGATDVYALGAVAYCCLAGRPPYVGDHPLQVLAQLVTAEPPTLPVEVPPQAAAVVMRALAKDPAHRYPSAAAFATAARAVPHVTQSPARGAGFAAPGAGFAAPAAGFAAPAAGFGARGPAAPQRAAASWQQPSPAAGSAALPPGGFTPGSASFSPGGFPPGSASVSPGGFTPGSASISPGGFPPGSASVSPGGFTPGSAAVPPAGFGAAAGAAYPTGVAQAAGSAPSAGFGGGATGGGGGGFGGGNPGKSDGKRRRNATVAAIAAGVLVAAIGIGTVVALGPGKGEANTSTNQGPDLGLADPDANPKGNPATTATKQGSKKPPRSRPATTAPVAEDPTEGPTTDPTEAADPTATGPTVGATNPHTPKAVCGSAFSVIDQAALKAGDGTVLGKVYLLYNESTGKNCTVTLKATDVGTASAASAYLEVQGADRVSDTGNFEYYAGPVRAAANKTCVKWGGSIGDAAYDSPFEHCG
ncbi:protein kinase domain-containing protein [Actinoplanes sp. CA-142083]|uniref:serine/threonine-protein kinase n=1 Tax=Actinoplanes sp. CA-142083 TaxID=3239903 RepID=UPI003D93EACE